MRKTILRLLIGAGAVLPLASIAYGQGEIISEGMLPQDNITFKLIVADEHNDSLYVLVWDEPYVTLFGQTRFSPWEWLFYYQIPGYFSKSELTVSSLGQEFIYELWDDSLRYGDWGQYHSVYSPGRPVVDAAGNIHEIWSGHHDSIYYYGYSVDTLATFQVLDTLSNFPRFIRMVTSPNDSVIAAIFWDSVNDRIDKFLADAGHPIDFESEPETLNFPLWIYVWYDVIIDYDTHLYFIGRGEDYLSCPGPLFRCHYVWSEGHGHSFIAMAGDDWVDGPAFQFSFGPDGKMILLKTGTPPWGYFLRFFASPDSGTTWYESTFEFPRGYYYYGSMPRVFADTVHLFYYGPNRDGPYQVYYHPIPTDSIFSHLVSVEGEEIALPADIHLSNYPNPFNSRTAISFNLSTQADITLKVFDVTGGIVTTLYKGHADAGPHSVVWDGKNSSGQPVSSGVYFYRLGIDGKDSVTKRMLLLK